MDNSQAYQEFYTTSDARLIANEVKTRARLESCYWLGNLLQLIESGRYTGSEIRAIIQNDIPRLKSLLKEAI